MKKVLNFDKEINFPTMIGEITAISLNHNLQFTSNSDIEGSFFIKGSYKMTEASHIEEEFDYNIPIDIALTENMDIDTCKVEIEDFYYEIVNDDTLKCVIDVLVEGVEEINIEEDEDEEEPHEKIEKEIITEAEILENDSRECDDDKEKEKEIPKKKEEKEVIKPNLVQVKEENLEEYFPKEDKQEEKIETIFSAFRDTEETFKSYTVYIMRKNDTLEKIYDLYDVTHEELSNYNQLEDIGIGTKIIIPTGRKVVSE